MTVIPYEGVIRPDAQPGGELTHLPVSSVPHQVRQHHLVLPQVFPCAVQSFDLFGDSLFVILGAGGLRSAASDESMPTACSSVVMC